MLAQNPMRLPSPISTPKIPCTTISYNSGEKSIRRESLRRRSRRASTRTRRRRRGLHVKRANGRRRTRRTRKLRAGLIRCVGSRHYFSLSVLEVDPQIETGVVMTGPNVDARPVQDVVEMTALGAEHQCEGVVSDLDHLPVARWPVLAVVEPERPRRGRRITPPLHRLRTPIRLLIVLTQPLLARNRRQDDLENPISPQLISTHARPNSPRPNCPPSSAESTPV